MVSYSTWIVLQPILGQVITVSLKYSFKKKVPTLVTGVGLCSSGRTWFVFQGCLSGMTFLLFIRSWRGSKEESSQPAPVHAARVGSSGPWTSLQSSPPFSRFALHTLMWLYLSSVFQWLVPGVVVGAGLEWSEKSQVCELTLPADWITRPNPVICVTW